MDAQLVAAAEKARLRKAQRSNQNVVLLRLLNSLELVCNGTRVEVPQTAQRLLAFVAVNRRPVQRCRVAGSLWPTASERRAGASLRSALWRLRHCGDEVIEASGYELRLAPSVRVDLYEAEAAARNVLEGRDEGVVRSDLDDFRHDLLPGWYDDWVLIEREYFRQLRLRALEVACDRLVAVGRLDAALSAGLAALECEPLRESAHRALVRIHLAHGNVSEAIRQYQLCRSLLLEQVGVVPSEQMTDLLRDIVRLQPSEEAREQSASVKGRAA
jgi:DNA-binding SARP family transcriptional activator